MALIEGQKQAQLSQASDLATLAEFFVREIKQRGHSWEEAEVAHLARTANFYLPMSYALQN